jgi:hypothetical protein
VEPTRAGAVLLAHADAITTRLAAARAEIAGLDGGRGALPVGIFQSVGAGVVPEVRRSSTGIRGTARPRARRSAPPSRRTRSSSSAFPASPSARSPADGCVSGMSGSRS